MFNLYFCVMLLLLLLLYFVYFLSSMIEFRKIFHPPEMLIYILIYIIIFIFLFLPHSVASFELLNYFNTYKSCQLFYFEYLSCICCCCFCWLCCFVNIETKNRETNMYIICAMRIQSMWASSNILNVNYFACNTVCYLYVWFFVVGYMLSHILFLFLYYTREMRFE